MAYHLYLVFFDLPNAFGSVPHNLLWAAFDCFSVPKAITALIKSYFQDIELCKTTEEYTTTSHHPCLTLGGRRREAQIWSTPSYERYIQVGSGAYQSSKGSCQSSASTSGKNPYQQWQRSQRKVSDVDTMQASRTERKWTSSSALVFSVRLTTPADVASDHLQGPSLKG